MALNQKPSPSQLQSIADSIKNSLFANKNEIRNGVKCHIVDDELDTIEDEATKPTKIRISAGDDNLKGRRLLRQRRINRRKRRLDANMEFVTIEVPEIYIGDEIKRLYYDFLVHSPSSWQSYFTICRSLNKFYMQQTWLELVKPCTKVCIAQHLQFSISELKTFHKRYNLSPSWITRNLELQSFFHLYTITDNDQNKNENINNICTLLEQVIRLSSKSDVEAFVNELLVDEFIGQCPEHLLGVCKRLNLRVPIDIYAALYGVPRPPRDIPSTSSSTVTVPDKITRQSVSDPDTEAKVMKLPVFRRSSKRPSSSVELTPSPNKKRIPPLSLAERRTRRSAVKICYKESSASPTTLSPVKSEPSTSLSSRQRQTVASNTCNAMDIKERFVTPLKVVSRSNGCSLKNNKVTSPFRTPKQNKPTDSTATVRSRQNTPQSSTSIISRRSTNDGDDSKRKRKSSSVMRERLAAMWMSAEVSDKMQWRISAEARENYTHCVRSMKVGRKEKDNQELFYGREAQRVNVFRTSAEKVGRILIKTRKRSAKNEAQASIFETSSSSKCASKSKKTKCEAKNRAGRQTRYADFSSYMGACMLLNTLNATPSEVVTKWQLVARMRGKQVSKIQKSLRVASKAKHKKLQRKVALARERYNLMLKKKEWQQQESCEPSTSNSKAFNLLDSSCDSYENTNGSTASAPSSTAIASINGSASGGIDTNPPAEEHLKISPSPMRKTDLFPMNKTI